jgi:hypothetical protein
MASFTGFASQQLIQLIECQQTNDTAIVSLSRTNESAASGKRTNPLRYNYFLPMAVAIEVGILQPLQDYTSVLASGCITGNCTFPASDSAALSTLAISHSCEDVTLDVQHIPLNRTRLDSNDTETTVPDIIKLDNGTAIQNFNLTLSLDDGSESIGFPVMQWPGSLMTGVSSLDFNGSIATIKMINQPNKWEDQFYYQAISCSLYPSVNTYTVEYNNAVLNETLISSVPVGQNILRDNSSEYLVWWKLGTTHTLRNGSRRVCDRMKTPSPGYVLVAEGNIDASPRNISRTADIPHDLGETWYIPEDCIWTLLYPAAYGIQDYLKLVFDHEWYGNGPKYTIGSTHLKTLENNGSMTLESVDKFMKNLTTSMSAVVRKNSPNNDQARGTMLYTTTCIRIEWSWISFPAVMIGLSAIFLVLVHIESRDVASNKLWKSSTLAMLFCDMDNAVSDKVKPLKKERMRAVAETTSVYIDRDGTEFRLIAK